MPFSLEPRQHGAHRPRPRALQHPFPGRCHGRPFTRTRSRRSPDRTSIPIVGSELLMTRWGFARMAGEARFANRHDRCCLERRYCRDAQNRQSGRDLWRATRAAQCRRRHLPRRLHAPRRPHPQPLLMSSPCAPSIANTSHRPHRLRPRPSPMAISIFRTVRDWASSCWTQPYSAMISFAKCPKVKAWPAEGVRWATIGRWKEIR